MAIPLDANAATIEEHDGSFGVKKVSLFLSNAGTLVRAAGDANGNFIANQIFSTITDGNKTSSSPGTPVQLLVASTACSQITITARLGNTSTVAVGGSAVVAAAGTEKGIPLIQGQSVTIAIDNVNKIYLDVITSGDGVTFSYQS